MHVFTFSWFLWFVPQIILKKLQSTKSSSWNALCKPAPHLLPLKTTSCRFHHMHCLKQDSRKNLLSVLFLKRCEALKFTCYGGWYKIVQGFTAISRRDPVTEATVITVQHNGKKNTLQLTPALGGLKKVQGFGEVLQNVPSN